MKVSLSTRVDAIGLKLWRDDMAEMMAEPIPRKQSRRSWLDEVESKLSHFEAGYQQLKEAATTLELALWKTKLDEFGKGGDTIMSNKKRKIDDSDIRNRCRISCGADIVIQHVLSYLVVPPPEDCQSDVEDNDSCSEENGDDMDSESDGSTLEEIDDMVVGYNNPL